jgi:hypothetical protein
MKPIAAGVVGAILATGLMYVVMRPDRPVEPPAPTAVVQPATPAPAPETATQEPAVGSNPAPAAVAPAPSRAVDRRPPIRDRRTPRAERKPSAPVPAAPTTVAQTTAPTPQTPAAQSPTTTASAPPTPQTNSDLVWTPPPPPPTTDSKIAVVEEKKPERVPQTVTIPAGTLLSIRVDQSLSTSSNQTGDSFRATLDQPIVVDSFVIAERGSRVEGRVVESDPGGRVQGVAKLSVELVRLNSSDGQRLRLQTEPFAKQANKETKRDVAKVGAAAGIGAAIGAIAGGGKGAAIGAAVGGAAGAGGVAATRGASAEIPAETRMTFRLRDAITVTEKLK